MILKVEFIMLFSKNLINIALKNSSKMYSLIFKKTVMSLENYF